MTLNTQKSSLKILVTGGAGFIGSALLRYIINDTNYSVVNIDKLTYAGNLQSLEVISKNPRYFFEQVDICDASELTRVFNLHQPDIVMHLAAESHVDRSIDGPGTFIQTNIVGTYCLLEQVRNYWTNLQSKKKIDSVFIMFQQMKFMVTCHTQMTRKLGCPCLLKLHLINLARHTVLQKPHQTIWFARGLELMVYQRLLRIALIIMGLIIFLKN